MRVARVPVPLYNFAPGSKSQHTVGMRRPQRETFENDHKAVACLAKVALLAVLY